MLAGCWIFQVDAFAIELEGAVIMGLPGVGSRLIMGEKYNSHKRCTSGLQNNSYELLNISRQMEIVSFCHLLIRFIPEAHI